MRFANLPRQPFIALALAAATGIIAADFFPVRPPAVAAFLIVGATVPFILRWPNLASTYALVGFGFFLVHSFQIRETPGLRLAARLGERARILGATGFVTSEPKTNTNGFTTFLFKLESIQFEGKTFANNATLLVRWPGNPELSDELRIFGVAEPIEPPRNPGEFDMRSYLARQDIYRSLFVRYVEDGVLLQRGAGNPVLVAAQKSRRWMQAALCRGLDDSPDVENFLNGIVLGLRHQTPEDIEEPFQQTGTLHLFAVAGLHVGIVARLLWILAMMAHFSRRWATAVIIPLLLFYSAITGLHVSSVRAAVMSSILLGGFFFERKVFTLNSLAAAAFFLLCWNTNELFAAGFQLSFAVVGAIVLLADPLSATLQKVAAPDPFLPRSLLTRSRRLIGSIFASICRGGSVSLAAWIGSLLLILWYFHLVTPVSLIANLMVVPIAFFILAIAMLSMLSAPLLASVSTIFNNANWVLARLVLSLVHWFAQLPGGHYYLVHPPWRSQPRLEITVLDYGTGAAAHLRTRNGDWLFDCGSERDYGKTLRPYLHAAGMNELDGLLLSHGDSLHIGATESLLHDFRPRVLIDNAATDRSIVHRRLRSLFAQQRLNSMNLSTGKTFNLSPAISAKVLFPERELTAKTADDEALVVQVSIPPRTKVMFVSDAGFETEKKLLGSNIDLRSDVLIKGQHHSGQSGSAPFLDAVRPRLIIATSRDFPESERIPDEWAGSVRARGIKLFRQDETGAVELQFEEREWTARAYVTGEIFRSVN